MNRSLILLLVALVAAGVLGTLIARDPGYVMIAWDGHTLQTGLWVLVALIALVLVTGFYLFRFVRFLLATGGLVRSWRSEKQRNKARAQTARGIVLLTEGAVERAEKLLKNGAGSIDYPVVNFLQAARAADRRGDVDERERLLGEALDEDGAARQAVLVASAEMDLERDRFQRALDSLNQADASDTVNRLKSKAMLAVHDWQGLADLMPVLKKEMPGEALLSLQKQIALQRMAESKGDDALSVIFKKSPEAVRHDPAVILRYCEKLESETEAEVAVRDALNRDWRPELLEIYGDLGEKTLGRRLKTVENWQRHHSDDAGLQLCLGQLYEAKGDRHRAIDAMRKSIDLGGPSLAYQRLGRLLAFEGHYKESSEVLSLALTRNTGTAAS